VPAIVGVTEPIRVPSGFLHEGALPEGQDGADPAITSATTPGGVWVQGQLGASLDGRVTEDAYSVGFELGGLSTGFWVVPVGALDPQYPGERQWHVDLDVGGWTPSGSYDLRMVAFDVDGQAGPPKTLRVCVVDPSVPDNLNACDPTLPPPDTVIVLRWDQDVDLDLVVYTPSGKRVDKSHPTTAPVGSDGTVPPSDLSDPTVGRLDHDSNAACLIDGRNAESLRFQEPTSEPGQYGIYADLYDACGLSSVRFEVVVYRRQANPDGTYALVSTLSRTGLLQDQAASGGANQPLFVMNVSLP